MKPSGYSHNGWPLLPLHSGWPLLPLVAPPALEFVPFVRLIASVRLGRTIARCLAEDFPDEGDSLDPALSGDSRGHPWTAGAILCLATGGVRRNLFSSNALRHSGKGKWDGAT